MPGGTVLELAHSYLERMRLARRDLPTEGWGYDMAKAKVVRWLRRGARCISTSKGLSLVKRNAECIDRHKKVDTERFI